MISSMSVEEKNAQVRKSFCFYLDIRDIDLAGTISRRIQDMGLQQEVFLTPRVTHVIRDRILPFPVAYQSTVGASKPLEKCQRREGRSRADAMLERVRPDIQQPIPEQKYVQITVQKAISLLDKLYDTFFRAPHKPNVKYFTKHYIKIEFLDKPFRPVFKEFDEWPEISLEPNPPKVKKESPKNKIPIIQNNNHLYNNIIGQKMTRKSRPRIKEKEQKGGYCEMCHTDFIDAALHKRSPHHLAYVRDHTNFLALDSLISAGADVATFLDNSTPINCERRSLRKICNGDSEKAKSRRSKRSQSPDLSVNGNLSPKQNGVLEDDVDRKHNTRCSKRSIEAQEDKQYYKVVSTKLRSSGGFIAKKKESPPTCNGAKPLVVKFRKIRKSELSVLSDEAEQFMFPRRASSASSTSSNEEYNESVRNIPPQPPPPQIIERQRLARPLALKEESSGEDSWLEDNIQQKRKTPPVARRTRRVPGRSSTNEQLPEQEIPVPKPEIPEVLQASIEEVCPLREEPIEKCMRWEDGKLKYTPAVEQLEFAFESVPHSEPWFNTFRRQDQDKIITKNVPKYFALYSKSPKLPYEIGQLPPLKPNCCHLSDLVKREEKEKPGPSRSYGTRNMKKLKIKKQNRTTAIIALDSHPRKSPREHASTLAILGSAGLLHRRKYGDDTKSTASEDTISDIHSHFLKLDTSLTQLQETSERLQQFLSEVFEDAAEYEVSEEAFEGEPAVATTINNPDVLSLVSEYDNCDIICNEMKNASEHSRAKRGRFKKKNRTGWPNKRKQKKGSRTNSDEQSETNDAASITEHDDTTQDTFIEEDTNMSMASSATDDDKALIDMKEDTRENGEIDTTKDEDKTINSDDKPLIVLKEKMKREAQHEDKVDETDDKNKKKKRCLQGLGEWMQPFVRVARVDPQTARRLRSANRVRTNRFR